MSNLSDYFRRKLASTISRRVNQKNRTAQYEYEAEVIQLRPSAVVVNMTRRMFSPAGPAYAGEDVYLGDQLIPLGHIRGLEDFWRSAIAVADPDTALHLEMPEPSELRTAPDQDLELLEG